MGFLLLRQSSPRMVVVSVNCKTENIVEFDWHLVYALHRATMFANQVEHQFDEIRLFFFVQAIQLSMQHHIETQEEKDLEMALQLSKSILETSAAIDQQNEQHSQSDLAIVSCATQNSIDEYRQRKQPTFKIEPLSQGEILFYCSFLKLVHLVLNHFEAKMPKFTCPRKFWKLEYFCPFSLLSLLGN